MGDHQPVGDLRSYQAKQQAVENGVAVVDVLVRLVGDDPSRNHQQAKGAGGGQDTGALLIHDMVKLIALLKPQHLSKLAITQGKKLL